MKKIIPLIFIFLLIKIPTANAFWSFGLKSATQIAKITKSKKALPDDEIIRLSKLTGELKGTNKVGQQLGKLKLSNEVLEDTYIRIAIFQGKITRREAESMYVSLGGVPGFRSTLRKVIGNNSSKTIGHLNELKIAETASRNGFKVSGIGEKFIDGIKKAPTDIDIMLKKGGKTFAIEAKAYSSTTKMPIDKYRADLDTLVKYKNKHKHLDDVVPIFTFTNKPNDLQYMKILQHEADKRGVYLIFGNSLEQIEQTKMLELIL